MARIRAAAKLHLLTVREVQFARDGDHSDGGGLMLRIRGESASWVLRFTAPTGRRREMGLGVVRRSNPKQAGDSLSGARDDAHVARGLLRQQIDPIDARDAESAKKREADQAKKADKVREHTTLARAAREFHERVIEPSRTTKHAAQWIASLENHVPAALWRKPIADIDAPELLAALSTVRALDDKEARVPETLQRVRASALTQCSRTRSSTSGARAIPRPRSAARCARACRARPQASSPLCPTRRRPRSCRACAQRKALPPSASSSRS